MEIELPTTGCNVFNGTYIDNYYNNTRTRYYFNDGQLIESSRQNYNIIPNGVTCLNSTQHIFYKPELEIYFGVLSLAICLLAFSLIYKIMIKRLLP